MREQPSPRGFNMLAPGNRLGPYDVSAAIGAGGMGEVYRARDTRLGRDIALKIIPDALVASPDRIARFEREAKLLASLNHPNIATLHGLEVADGRHLLVMELLEGDTLAARIARGPLPTAEALAVAEQVADALEAAHERGVIHRDLKPANVMLTRGERVKVLDFGLAKVVATEVGQERVDEEATTVTGHVTDSGMVLGTAAYMSPEQARGLPVDHRTDIFSFGIVLFEMLSGHTPFTGVTTTDVLASVVSKEPAWTLLPHSIDLRVDSLLRRCLEKSLRQRWQAIGDVRYEIGQIRTTRSSHTQSPKGVASRRVFVASVLSAAAGAAVTHLARSRTETPARQTQVRIYDVPTVRASDGLAAFGINRRSIAISPDGMRIVYSAGGALHVFNSHTHETKKLDVDRVTGAIAISYDGGSIAYWAEGKLRSVPIDGGVPRPLCYALQVFGLSWKKEGILFSGFEGAVPAIFRITEQGDAKSILKGRREEWFDSPQYLPGGGAVLFTTVTSASPMTADWDDAKICIESLSNHERVTVATGADGRYLSTGHVVFARGGDLEAVAIERGSWQPKGKSLKVQSGVLRMITAATGQAEFDISEEGDLAYVSGPEGSVRSRFSIVTTDTAGKPIATLAIDPGPHRYPRASPDGKYVAYVTEDAANSQIYLYDLRNGGAPKLFTSEGRNNYPVWSPNSDALVFQSDRRGQKELWRQAVGGGDAVRLGSPLGGIEHIPDAWFGDKIAVTVKTDLMAYSLKLCSTATTDVEDLKLATSMTPPAAVFSPDGLWIAYAISEENPAVTDLYFYSVVNHEAHPRPRPQGELNPHHPVWTKTNELFYVPKANALAFVTVKEGATGVTPSIPQDVVRKFPRSAPYNAREFDITPDRYILSQDSARDERFDKPGVATIKLVVNWVEQLKQLVPTN